MSTTSEARHQHGVNEHSFTLDHRVHAYEGIALRHTTEANHQSYDRTLPTTMYCFVDIDGKSTKNENTNGGFNGSKSFKLQCLQTPYVYVVVVLGVLNVGQSIVRVLHFVCSDGCSYIISILLAAFSRRLSYRGNKELILKLWYILSHRLAPRSPSTCMLDSRSIDA